MLEEYDEGEVDSLAADIRKSHQANEEDDGEFEIPVAAKRNITAARKDGPASGGSPRRGRPESQDIGIDADNLVGAGQNLVRRRASSFHARVNEALER